MRLLGLGMAYCVHGLPCPSHASPTESTFGRERRLADELFLEELSQLNVHLPQIIEFGTTYACCKSTLYLL